MSSGTTDAVGTLLALVRLGDVDMLGWWRSRSADDVAEYVLGRALPSTWLATGLELGMESARVRHDAVLGRETAVHLFSDYLPFHQLTRSWLIERKLERDLGPLNWIRTATVADIQRSLGEPVDGERRAGGRYLGHVTIDDLEDHGRQHDLLYRLAGAYVEQGEGFLAPYVDLTA